MSVCLMLDENFTRTVFLFCACFCSFQELDLSTNAYIFSGSVREEEWFSKVIDALHKKASYRKVWL